MFTAPGDDVAGVSAPCPVAATMRRVQAQLRAGAAPTFESLLAYGEPSPR